MCINSILVHCLDTGFRYFAVQEASDAPIWNLADIPITDIGSEISADTDS